MRLALCLSLALFAACTDTDEPVVDTGPLELPDRVAGAPMAGAAEGTLKLPAGTPLSGYSSRCKGLGGVSKPDARETPYNVGFVPSAGVHIRPTIKAVWIENGDQHLVMTKTDTIYSFDGLVEAVTARLEEATGESLQGQVTHSANHNHSAYGDFSKHVGLFLGHDKYNEEVFQRMVDQIVAVSLQAYEARQPAALGLGWAKDWDPDGLVYSDRRGINDDLMIFDDLGAEQGGKDPYMQLMRVDAASGEPIAIVMGWGMHPYVQDNFSALASADATALIEAEVAESFDEPVVAMFVQTSGGDASVRGLDEGWPRMETVGVLARDAILDTWSATPTSSEPITLETTTVGVPMAHDGIRVTRGGTVDWRYTPYSDDPDFLPDDQVWSAEGELLSPIDEFNTAYGAVFCGSGGIALPGASLPGESEVYANCLSIESMTPLLAALFHLDDVQAVHPLEGLSQTTAAASHIGPLPVLQPDGTVSEGVDTLFGFWPGETLHFFTEQFKHRAGAELGYANVFSFGYSMDHEGYLTIPEDWLLGEYESDITFQGPLAAEHIMESTLHHTADVLSSEQVEPLPEDAFFPYAAVALTPHTPDATPEAGTPVSMDDLTALGEHDDVDPERPIYHPRDIALDVGVPAQLPRVQGMVQFAWKGGDAAVDNPRVTLQRQAEDGTWQAVTSRAGRPINDDHHDFALTWTPYPAAPHEAEQTHYWWVVWQAVGHIHDRPGLPLGTYRLHIEGNRWTSGDVWPFETASYEISTPAFEVVPAEISLQATEDGLLAWIEGPEDGFRMIDIDGTARGRNPLRGGITVDLGDGDTEVFEAPAPQDGRTLIPWSVIGEATQVEITDGFGNVGVWDMEGQAER